MTLAPRGTINTLIRYGCISPVVLNLELGNFRGSDPGRRLMKVFGASGEGKGLISFLVACLGLYSPYDVQPFFIRRADSKPLKDQLYV